jgi:hypothetical protein
MTEHSVATRELTPTRSPPPASILGGFLGDAGRAAHRSCLRGRRGLSERPARLSRVDSAPAASRLLAFERRLIGQTAAHRREPTFLPRTLNNRRLPFRGAEPPARVRPNPALADGRRCR